MQNIKPMSNKYFSVLILITFSNFSYAQFTKDYVDIYSQTSIELLANKGDKGLWSGTGFLIDLNNKIYLITNNHIVGEEYKKNEYKQLYNRDLPPDSIPDALLLKCYSEKLNQWSVNKILIRPKNEPLFIKFYEDDNDKNTILDVVAIPIDTLPLNNNSARLVWLSNIDLHPEILLYPSEELFIVGYPSDAGKINPLPIWKRGTIASEPNLEKVNASWFWIDATTRGGMSGSPVFIRASSFVTKSGVTQYTQVVTSLIGIYSAQNYSLELGRVTKLDKVFAKLLSIKN